MECFAGSLRGLAAIQNRLRVVRWILRQSIFRRVGSRIFEKKSATYQVVERTKRLSSDASLLKLKARPRSDGPEDAGRRSRRKRAT